MPSPARQRAWLAVCALMMPALGEAQERPWQELVEIIVRDGPRAIAIRTEVDVVRRDQQSRLTVPNPGVSFSREGAGFTEFLQAEQALPVFGIRGALRRAGVAATSAAEAERDVRLWDLRIEATRRLARWTGAQARARVAAADVDAVARLVDVQRTREREGDGSRFDRLRTEQELAELHQLAVGAEIELLEARAAVLALLPDGVQVATVTGAPAPATAVVDPDAMWGRARTTRAELRALTSAGEHAALEAEAARHARRPVPVVSGGLKRADTGSRREVGGVFGLSFAVPLTDPGTSEAARWTAQGVRLAAERAALEREIQAEVRRAADALTRRRQALADAAADAAVTELVEAAEVAYREGEIGVSVLLDAVRTAGRSRRRDLERRLDLRLAEIALEGAVGEVLWP